MHVYFEFIFLLHRVQCNAMKIDLTIYVWIFLLNLHYLQISFGGSLQILINNCIVLMLIFAKNGKFYTRTEGGEVIANFSLGSFPIPFTKLSLRYSYARSLDSVHSSRKPAPPLCERIDVQMSTHFKYFN